jgi:NAD+ synthase (glutamine-hydrolysing)
MQLDAERGKNTTFLSKPADDKYRKIVIPSPLEPAKKPLTLTRRIDPAPFIPSGENDRESCEELFSIQVSGLAKRLVHSGAKSVLIGVSGGLDSALALLVCVKTADRLGLPRETVCGVTMAYP